MKRLRIGILLIIISWLPFAQLFISIGQRNGYLQDSHSVDVFRLSVWGVQIAIGLIGLWLVGNQAAQEAKSKGWRKVPGLLWELFWHGTSPDH